MTTNTARIDRKTEPPYRAFGPRQGLVTMLVWASFAFPALPSAHGETTLTPWMPVYKGVDRAIGTNIPGIGSAFWNLQVVHLVRVDLTDPDVRLLATRRHTNYVAEYWEAAGHTVSNWLRLESLQAAINANNFHDPGQNNSPPYTRPEGSLFEISGVSLSEGLIVSVQESAEDAAAIFFSSNNVPTFVPTNWPARSTAGFFTAVSGLYSILVNGVNIGSNYLASSAFVHQTQPRTVIGVSQDRRYLYLMAIDGRQAGYSDGARDWESAGWLLLAGGWDGINMDGGGSTTLVIADTTGRPVTLNRSSAALDPGTGRERTVGSHLGVYARLLPGFINDVHALPDDTAATITWTTVAASTTQVEYGPTPAFGSFSPAVPDLVTSHAALLSGLSPDSGYFFRVISTLGPTQYVSSNFFFVTANYAITNSIFELTNAWKYSVANLDGINWTATNYDDAGWGEPKPALLWADIDGFPEPDIPAPMSTEMPLDTATAYPYPTYYFRTHFTYTNVLTNVSLLIHAYLDDGGVFYLNGAELRRTRMAPPPTVIVNATFATNYPCSGNATCPDDFVVTGVTNLVLGDNVLAVETHNRSQFSSDITFGMALAYSVPYASYPTLRITRTDATVTLSWDHGGYTLQQADSPAGPWVNVPGQIVNSPYTTTTGPSTRYFRLVK